MQLTLSQDDRLCSLILDFIDELELESKEEYEELQEELFNCIEAEIYDYILDLEMEEENEETH